MPLLFFLVASVVALVILDDDESEDKNASLSGNRNRGGSDSSDPAKGNVHPVASGDVKKDGWEKVEEIVFPTSSKAEDKKEAGKAAPEK